MVCMQAPGSSTERAHAETVETVTERENTVKHSENRDRRDYPDWAGGSAQSRIVGSVRFLSSLQSRA
jgi:hypothetical protein